jgi:hypothetical protein
MSARLLEYVPSKAPANKETTAKAKINSFFIII